jgi:peptidoglycan/xylan/chitin deacetylase (PgdA/CDA1 family)
MTKSNTATSRTLPSKRHIAMVGFGIITLGIVLAIALLVHLADYTFATSDKPNVLYNGLTTRTLAEASGTQPAFVAQYPITGNVHVDSSIRTHIDDIVRPYLVARRGLGEKVQYEQLRVDYSVQFYNKKVLSIQVFQQKSRPEGIVDAASETFVYDMQSSKQIGASDIVTNMPALLDILYDYLRRNYQVQLTQADLINVLDMQPKDFIQIIPYQNVVSFTFDPRVTKQPAKPITLGISTSLLQGIIADKYLEVSGDLANKQPDIHDVITAMPSRDEPINPAGNLLALTFDDGPGADTPRLLDALKKYRAHATFFVIGNRVGRFGTAIQREVAEGNEIGNHSWNHSDLTRLDGAAIEHQIQDTQTAIRQVTGGYAPRLVRPPYGAINSGVSTHLGGLTPTLWTVDTLDWRDRDTGVIFSRVMASAQNKSIILLHDIHPKSVDAAILAIRQLRAQGWQLVTVSQLH